MVFLARKEGQKRKTNQRERLPTPRKDCSKDFQSFLFLTSIKTQLRHEAFLG